MPDSRMSGKRRFQGSNDRLGSAGIQIQFLRSLVRGSPWSGSSNIKPAVPSAAEPNPTVFKKVLLSISQLVARPRPVSRPSGSLHAVLLTIELVGLRSGNEGTLGQRECPADS